MPKSSKKVTAEDVPSLGKGKKEGLARKAARAIESREALNRAALSVASAALDRLRKAQSTDSNN